MSVNTANVQTPFTLTPTITEPVGNLYPVSSASTDTNAKIIGFFHVYHPTTLQRRSDIVVLVDYDTKYTHSRHGGFIKFTDTPIYKGYYFKQIGYYLLDRKTTAFEMPLDNQLTSFDSAAISSITPEFLSCNAHFHGLLIKEGASKYHRTQNSDIKNIEKVYQPKEQSNVG